MQHQLDTDQHTLTLNFSGDVLSTNATPLRNEIFGVLESPALPPTAWNVLHLDLSKAKMIDSMGLNLIVSIVRAMKTRNAKITTTVSSQNVYRTILFTRLDKQMEVRKV
jgi:anti-anti-sigma factor